MSIAQENIIFKEYLVLSVFFSNLTYIVWSNKPTLKWASYASSENQKIENTLQKFMKNRNCFDSVSQEKNSLHQAVSH